MATVIVELRLSLIHLNQQLLWSIADYNVIRIFIYKTAFALQTAMRCHSHRVNWRIQTAYHSRIIQNAFKYGYILKYDNGKLPVNRNAYDRNNSVRYKLMRWWNIISITEQKYNFWQQITSPLSPESIIRCNCLHQLLSNQDFSQRHAFKFIFIGCNWPKLH